MTHTHEVGEELVLRLQATIEGSTATDGEVRAYQVRLETGDLLGLTPEQLAVAVDAERARDLLLGHVRTGEPLDWSEVETVVAAGLARVPDFMGVGGGLYQHRHLSGEE